MANMKKTNARIKNRDKQITKKYTLDEIDSVLKAKSWWAAIFILPFSNLLTLFLLNKTKVTPTQVTWFSLLIGIGAAFSFFTGHFIIGALLFQLHFLLDCVDGAIARLRNMKSKFGAYIDIVNTVFVSGLCIVSLYFSKEQKAELILLLFIYMLTNSLVFIKDSIFIGANHGFEPKKKSNIPILKHYLNFVNKYNLVVFPIHVECDALIFVFYAIFSDYSVFLGSFLLYFVIMLKSLNSLLSFLLVMKDQRISNK